MLLSWPQHALDATHLAFYWNFQRALGVFTLLTISRAFRQFLFGLLWDMPARSWRCSLRFSWTFFCLIFLRRIKLQHALDATLLASSWDIPHSWWYVLGSGSDTLLMLCAEPSLGTVRDALDATVHHSRDNTLLTFFLELPTRSCWCYAPPLDAAVWRKSRSWCCALSFVLEHAGRSSCYAVLFLLKHSSMLWMPCSDPQHPLDARLLVIFSWPFTALSWYYSLSFLLELPASSWCYALGFLLELPVFFWC